MPKISEEGSFSAIRIEFTSVNSLLLDMRLLDKLRMRTDYPNSCRPLDASHNHRATAFHQPSGEGKGYSATHTPGRPKPLREPSSLLWAWCN